MARRAGFLLFLPVPVPPGPYSAFGGGLGIWGLRLATTRGGTTAREPTGPASTSTNDNLVALRPRCRLHDFLVAQGWITPGAASASKDPRQQQQQQQWHAG